VTYVAGPTDVAILASEDGADSTEDCALTPSGANCVLAVSVSGAAAPFTTSFAAQTTRVSVAIGGAAPAAGRGAAALGVALSLALGVLMISF
jgi:hypothetical protein